MDELEFRRRVYADPDSKDMALYEAAKSDPAKHKFLSETRQLNEHIKSATKVPVPDDLADKLIWQSTMREHARQQQRSRMHIAMAASVAFAIGLSFALWKPNNIDANGFDIGEAALAHMSHAPTELAFSTSLVSLEQVNAKLMTMGSKLTGSIGEIHAANYCHLDKVKSLHVIIDSVHGPISVFFLPEHSDMSMPERFADDTYNGKGFSAQQANVMVVGSKEADLNMWAGKVKDKLI